MGLSRAQTENLHQETFQRSWRNLGQYRPGLSRFSTWLYTIARNLVLNELEWATTRPMARNEPPEPVCERPRHDESPNAAKRRHLFHKALGPLALPDRSVLAVAYQAALAIAEIARIEGCSEGAAKTRLSTARGCVANILEKEQFDYNEEILRSRFFEPPRGFVDRVMAEIATEAPPAFATPRRARART